MNVILIQEGVLAPDEAWISIKTQFLTPEMHALIIGLLKYIKKRHLPSLEVNDEGKYWETGDYQELEDKMKLVQGKINDLSRELSSQSLGDLAGLAADEIADRIERFFHIEEPRTERGSGQANVRSLSLDNSGNKSRKAWDIEDSALGKGWITRR